MNPAASLAHIVMRGTEEDAANRHASIRGQRAGTPSDRENTEMVGVIRDLGGPHSTWTVARMTKREASRDLRRVVPSVRFRRRDG